MDQVNRVKNLGKIKIDHISISYLGKSVKKPLGEQNTFDS